MVEQLLKILFSLASYSSQHHAQVKIESSLRKQRHQNLFSLWEFQADLRIYSLVCLSLLTLCTGTDQHASEHWLEYVVCHLILRCKEQNMCCDIIQRLKSAQCVFRNTLLIDQCVYHCVCPVCFLSLVHVYVGMFAFFFCAVWPFVDTQIDD